MFALNKWKNKWGLPFPKEFKVPENAISWSISHRGQYSEFYNDIDGNPHPTGPGITTLYMLTEDGNNVFYADPWIPAKWGTHQVDLPYKGRLIAKNMMASGSTVFVINKVGDMYTRLYDFDTAGQNPILNYSWKRENRIGTNRYRVKTLPNETWRRQVPPRGRYTDKITVFMNGNKGSVGFTLRVEGMNDNRETGYFEKQIYENDWKFIVDNHKIDREFLKSLGVEKSTLLAAKKTNNYNGKIERPGIDFKLKAELVDFNVYISPAKIKLDIAGEKFDIPIYFRGQSEKNDKIKSRATALIPNSISESKNFYVKYVWDNIFKKSNIIDFTLESKNGLIEFKQDLHIFGLDEIADLYMFTIYRSIKEKVGLRESLALQDRELKPLKQRRLKMRFKIKNDANNK